MGLQRINSAHTTPSSQVPQLTQFSVCRGRVRVWSPAKAGSYRGVVGAGSRRRPFLAQETVCPSDFQAITGRWSNSPRARVGSPVAGLFHSVACGSPRPGAARSSAGGPEAEPVDPGPAGNALVDSGLSGSGAWASSRPDGAWSAWSARSAWSALGSSACCWRPSVGSQPPKQPGCSPRPTLAPCSRGRPSR